MSGAHVFIDRSQFPENVRRDLIESLRARAINHKFHYESYKQAAKWLALHEAHSPARNDASCLRIYDEAFAAVMRECNAPRVHLVGLGVGGAQKEARLAQWLGEQNKQVVSTISDVSLPLVLGAREAVSRFVDECHAVVLDLTTVNDLASLVDANDSERPRLLTLFGIIPNFEPALLFSRVAALLRPNDHFLFSANLAPGSDYAAGVEKVLPQYDNALTRDWLLTLLFDLGFSNDDGVLEFSIERDEQRLMRIVAYFVLKHRREIQILGERVLLSAGERIRVFFSYRHTMETITQLLPKHGLCSIGQYVNDTREEGVFLCRK